MPIKILSIIFLLPKHQGTVNSFLLIISFSSHCNNHQLKYIFTKCSLACLEFCYPHAPIPNQPSSHWTVLIVKYVVTILKLVKKPFYTKPSSRGKSYFVWELQVTEEDIRYQVCQPRKLKKVTCRVIAENLGGPSKRGEIHKLLLPCTMKSEVEFFDYVSFSKVNSKAFSARAIRKIKSSGLGPC